MAPRVSHVEGLLTEHAGPVIAASDHVSAVPDLIRAYVPRRYVVLGTDGYGRSDTRKNLRRFFEMDRHHIAVAALAALADDGIIDRAAGTAAISRYGIATTAAAPWKN
nr:pyruvate dehydrogenase E1 component [uncultured bacterium]